jgi:hypothetical protein
MLMTISKPLTWGGVIKYTTLFDVCVYLDKMIIFFEYIYIPHRITQNMSTEYTVTATVTSYNPFTFGNYRPAISFKFWAPSISGEKALDCLRRSLKTYPYTIEQTNVSVRLPRPREDLAFYEPIKHDGELHIQVDFNASSNRYYYWFQHHWDTESTEVNFKEAVKFILDPTTECDERPHH